MPRPGPRPYECIRRAWHSESHQPLRGSITQEILRVVTELHKLETRRKKEWQEKLPIVVLRAEEILYSKARSEENYVDLSTLRERLEDAVNTMIRKTDSQTEVPYMQPCVEAALCLGCSKKNPKGQRSGGAVCYGPEASKLYVPSAFGSAATFVDASFPRKFSHFPFSFTQNLPEAYNVHVKGSSPFLRSKVSRCAHPIPEAAMASSLQSMQTTLNTQEQPLHACVRIDPNAGLNKTFQFGHHATVPRHGLQSNLKDPRLPAGLSLFTNLNSFRPSEAKGLPSVEGFSEGDFRKKMNFDHDTKEETIAEIVSSKLRLMNSYCPSAINRFKDSHPNSCKMTSSLSSANCWNSQAHDVDDLQLRLAPPGVSSEKDEGLTSTESCITSRSPHQEDTNRYVGSLPANSKQFAIVKNGGVSTSSKRSCLHPFSLDNLNIPPEPGVAFPECLNSLMPKKARFTKPF